MDLYAPTLEALHLSENQYSLASLRYDLSKLRAKKLVEKVPKTRQHRLIGKGYSICVVFLKQTPDDKRTQPDRLHQRVKDDLDERSKAIGLKIAAQQPTTVPKFPLRAV